VKSFEEQIAGACAVKQINWFQAMQQLYDHYIRTGDKSNALRIMEGLCLELPYEESYCRQAGNLCLQMDEERKAWFYFTKMNALKPSSEAMSHIAVTLLRMDLPDEAIPYLDAVIRDKNNKVNFQPMKEIVEEIILLKKKLLIDPDTATLRRRIASAYQRIGNDKVAGKYILP
jgi:tetratricopeptide (TPR) repeat protein